MAAPGPGRRPSLAGRFAARGWTVESRAGRAVRLPPRRGTVPPHAVVDERATRRLTARPARDALALGSPASPLTPRSARGLTARESRARSSPASRLRLAYGTRWQYRPRRSPRSAGVVQPSVSRRELRHWRRTSARRAERDADASARPTCARTQCRRSAAPAQRLRSPAQNDEGPGSTPGGLRTTLLDFSRCRFLSAGGTNSGIDGGGVPVWIPLAAGPAPAV